MIVPRQLANTMELIFVRSVAKIGAVAIVVIRPPAFPQSSEERYLVE
jgi:hypothetical protein